MHNQLRLMTNHPNLYKERPHMVGLRKLRVLGTGACGVVYLGALVSQQQPNGKLIAVKSSKQPELAYLLQREACILKSLVGCEQIIQYIGSNIIAENNGQLIYNLMMEFAPNGSLTNLIKKRPLFESEARIYTRMILEGLQSIHRNGIVHCDLKPDNILLFPNAYDANFRLKIADFGLSSKAGENEEPNKSMGFRGTPLYMSPESLMGQIGAPLDIWSLGCILIEMITGSTAWCCTNTVETLMFKLGCLKEAPMIPDNLSQDCKDFLSKCFIKDPSERWSAIKLLNHPFLCQPDFKGVQENFTSFFSYEINV